jgi:hypothetical protein
MLTGILGAPLVETAIGLVLVWFLAASLCSGLVELIASALGFRANHLWTSLGRLLRSSATTPGAAAGEAARLGKRTDVSTSDPLAEFVAALPGVDANSLKRVRQIDTRLAGQALVIARKASEFEKTPLGQLVETLPASLKDNEERLQKWFEDWFDGRMALVRASYRRKIRWWAGLFGLFIVFGAGIDSLGLAERLYAQPAQRALLQAEATRLVDNVPCPDQAAAGSGTPPTTASFKGRLECAKKTAGQLSQLDISYWQVGGPKGAWVWARTVLGTFLSWGAVLAGAPFWYAVLKRLMTLQSKPAKGGGDGA